MRNPNAPADALVVSDIKPQLRALWHVPGSKPLPVKILGFPYKRRCLAKYVIVIAVEFNGIDDVWWLSDVGVVPDHRGAWSCNYLTRA